LERIVQRGGKCPVPGNIQGQVGQVSEQPDLVEDVPAHCRGVGLDDFKGLFQPKLFYDSSTNTSTIIFKTCLQSVTGSCVLSRGEGTVEISTVVLRKKDSCY